MLSNSGCYNAFASKLHMAEECLPFFQPVVDADSNLCGVEVLARWNMPDGRVLSPDLFISQVVHAGLSRIYDKYLIKKDSRYFTVFKTIFAGWYVNHFSMRGARQ